MSRIFLLLLLGCFSIGLTGCVGPRGAGCCGPYSSPMGCDSGCETGSCGSCDTCTGCGELYVDPWINNPADCIDPCDACGNYNGQSCGKCRSVFSGFKSLWGYRCGCAPGPVGCTDRNFAPSCGGCSSGCDGCMTEPACGCEEACSCGVLEPGCGCESECSCGVFEPGCGCEGECSCGFEPACGCESGGCNCGASAGVSQGPIVSEGVVSGRVVMEGEYIVESPDGRGTTILNEPYRPERSRKIFRARTQNARGFLNEFHR